ncbi:putative copper-exporting P-type ATPase A [uncultured archaeon]|nr:putative copper-exporting P-type ATPase A [uncultured archaeon]
METTLEVRGMHCRGCEMAISKALAGTPGVKSARVDYASERAIVEHDGRLEPADVASVIKEAGYEAGPAPMKTARKRFLGLF